MGNQYAHWDDSPYREPSRPPRRPDIKEWRRMNELERQAYEAGIGAYLLAVGTDRWYELLGQMAVFYQTWLWERGVQDANWKQGTP